MFRSPKFGDGTTSEAIDESGLNVFMFALSRGTGTARRFESVPADADEPINMGTPKPGSTTAMSFFQRLFAVSADRRRRN
jgi:hypothetical protein